MERKQHTKVSYNISSKLLNSERKKIPDLGRSLECNSLSKKHRYVICNRVKILNRNNPRYFKLGITGKITDIAILSILKNLRKIWVN